jgi:hypothetical protein
MCVVLEKIKEPSADDQGAASQQGLLKSNLLTPDSYFLKTEDRRRMAEEKKKELLAKSENVPL